MKLLILTQKVDMNDDVLGFFHGWIREFAKHCEKLTVICLYKGEYDLPDNVKVLSLGKEQAAGNRQQAAVYNQIEEGARSGLPHSTSPYEGEGYSPSFKGGARGGYDQKVVSPPPFEGGKTSSPPNSVFPSLGRRQNLPAARRVFPSLGRRGWGGLTLTIKKLALKLSYLKNFYKYIWQERKNYDTVFVHMNQIYVILGGLFWRAWHKKIALWYTHKHVSLSLRLAEKITHIIFTASKESFRLKSKKVNVMGHGIDVEKFKSAAMKENDGIFRIISVGRISPVKDYETLINTVELAIKSEPCLKSELKVDIVGGPLMPDDYQYFSKLKSITIEKGLSDVITYLGPVPNKDIATYYHNADLFVHMSNTGSLDKVVLEAMASGLMVVSSNDASKALIGDDYYFEAGDSIGMSKAIMRMKNFSDDARREICAGWRKLVSEKHGLESLIFNIVKIIKK